MRLLLVEDDSMIGEAARQGLRQEGHTVDWVRDGREAEAAVAAAPYDAVLLDLGLPRRDGLAILKTWRGRGVAVPVLIITARVRAVARRRSGRAESVVRIGELEIDSATRQVRWKGADVSLSPREYALL